MSSIATPDTLRNLITSTDLVRDSLTAAGVDAQTVAATHASLRATVLRIIAQSGTSFCNIEATAASTPRLHKVDYVMVPEKQGIHTESDYTFDQPKDRDRGGPDKQSGILETLTEMGIDVSVLDEFRGKEKKTGTFYSAIVVPSLGKTILYCSSTEGATYIIFDIENYEEYCKKSREELTALNGIKLTSIIWRGEGIKECLKKALSLEKPEDTITSDIDFFSDPDLLSSALERFFHESQSQTPAADTIYDLTETHLTSKIHAFIPGSGLVSGLVFLRRAATALGITTGGKDIIQVLLKRAGYDALDESFYGNTASIEATLTHYAQSLNKPISELGPNDQKTVIRLRNGQQLSFKRYILRVMKALTGVSQLNWTINDLVTIYDYIGIPHYNNCQKGLYKYFGNIANVVDDLRGFALASGCAYVRIKFQAFWCKMHTQQWRSLYMDCLSSTCTKIL